MYTRNRGRFKKLKKEKINQITCLKGSVQVKDDGPADDG